MQVHSQSGSAASILYDNIKKLTFTSQEGNGIATPSSSGVKVYLNDMVGDVIIESLVEITSVNLFNMQGTVLQYIAPRSTSAKVSLSARPSGVYIVQVSNGQGVSVHKILKR
jgi:helix-turn-helix protein